MALSILMAVFGIIVATAMIWYASEQLEDAAHQLAGHYGMPEIVKGTLLMAISSSFPELATVVLAGVVHGDFDLGIASIIGSAIFNILVIPGASALAQSKTFRTDHQIVYRETLFYLSSVLVIALLFCLAVIFFPLTSQGPLQGAMSWQLALFPLAFYILYGYIQWHEVKGNQPEPSLKVEKPWKPWSRLILSMVAVAIGVEILLNVVVGIGESVDVPTWVWGATIVAVVTSLPDLFMSVKAAQNHSSDSSMGNAVGSNTFDLLVVIPVGVLVLGYVPIHLEILLPLVAYLMLATVIIMVLMRENYELSRSNAWMLLFLYLVFLIWIFNR